METLVSPIVGPQEIPTVGSILDTQDYEGQRTASAIHVVSEHVRSFYQLFIKIGIILIISMFGIITIVFGYTKRNACPDVKNVSTSFIAFGIVVLIMCSIFIITLILGTTCCYNRTRLPLCLVFICMSLLSGGFLTIIMFLTEGSWMLMFFKPIFDGENNPVHCQTSVRYFMLTISICILSSFFSTLCYRWILHSKLQGGRTDHSNIRFTRLI